MSLRHESQGEGWYIIHFISQPPRWCFEENSMDGESVQTAMPLRCPHESNIITGQVKMGC